MSSGSDPRPQWIRRLVAELADFLQEPVILVESPEESMVGAEAFSCLIRSSPPKGGGFQLCWEGILGMQPIDGKPHTSVSLARDSRNQRLARPGHAEGSLLEIEYEGWLEHGGRWATVYWYEDGFGEYLSYDSYGS